MELSILDTVNLPDGSILSVRSGPTRRQSPLPCTAPFKLPGGPWPLRIDVLGLLGKTGPGVVLQPSGEYGLCKLPLESKNGAPMSVTLQIIDTAPGAVRPKPYPALSSKKPECGSAAAGEGSVKKRDAEADARAYLDKHHLHEFMHGLFELLLRERPEDPYTFIAARFKEAASLEVQSAPLALEALVMPSTQTLKASVSRSNVSTAPTSSALSNLSSAMSPSRDSVFNSTISAGFTEPVPEGCFKVIIRSLRGRSIARLVVMPGEKVIEIKKRLEATVGTSVAGMQLMWWAEMLPNDTTLEDHAIEPGPVALNLLVSQRDPRMRYLLSGASEGGMRLWNLADAEIVRSFQPVPQTAVLAMAVDWQRMRTVCATVDGRIQLWDLNTGELLKSVEGHKEQVDCLEADFERLQAISGSMDGTAKLWCLKELKCLLTFEAGCTVWTLSIDWANKRACGGLRSGIVRLWDLETGKVLDDYTTGHETAKAGDTSVSGVAIDCQGRRAVSGFEDGHLLYWSFADSISSSGLVDVKAQDQSVDKRSPTAPKAFLAHYSALRAIVAQWREKGSRALVGSDDGSLSLWRVETSECLARFARHVGFVWALQVDWARDRAVSGAFDGCVKLWDLRTGECLRTMQGHSRPVRSVAGGG